MQIQTLLSLQLTISDMPMLCSAIRGLLSKILMPIALIWFVLNSGLCIHPIEYKFLTVCM